jgi:hypothetical protein
LYFWAVTEHHPHALAARSDDVHFTVAIHVGDGGIKALPPKSNGEPAASTNPPRPAARPKQERGPVPSHPWRRFYFSKNSMQAKERRGELCFLRK